MVFNSVNFLIFFPVVVLVYFIVPKVLKNPWLLVTSYYFYMCSPHPEYVLLLLFSTISTFICANLIASAKSQRKKKLYLTTNIVISLSILFYFKYFNFFFTSIAEMFDVTVAPGAFSLALPVGISFFTFQSLGYAIDVYRGTVKREKNFLTYALFVSFFPQLVAGPIERSSNLLPQFKEYKKFSYDRTADGLRLMAWGFFKKMVIADRAAVIVKTVYSNPQDFTGIQLIAATVFFAFQIYCDFSGYSDIAIGGANILGFDLMRNFEHPYFAKNTGEFWRRWHISLSSWFMDYVYIPLGGSRKGYVRTLINLFITFLVSGLWHGAEWSFIAWGAVNGIFVILSRIYQPISRKVKKLLGINPNGIITKVVGATITFIMIDFAWIFFIAKNMQDAFYVINNLFTDLSLALTNHSYLISSLEKISFYSDGGMVIINCIIFMLFVELWEKNKTLVERLKNSNVFVRWAFYYTIILLLIFFGYFGKSSFIYFDF